MTFRFNDILMDAVKNGDANLANEVERRLETWFERPTVDSLWLPTTTGESPSKIVDFDSNGRITDGGTAFQVRTWTPTWGVSSGTAPTLGNGTLTGRYITLGDLTFATITQLMGSTTTYGSGTWTWTLPPDAPLPDDQIYPGTMQIRDNTGGSRYPGIVSSIGTTSIFCITGHDRLVVNQALPITWAQNDRITMNFTYFNNA